MLGAALLLTTPALAAAPAAAPAARAATLNVDWTLAPAAIAANCSREVGALRRGVAAIAGSRGRHTFANTVLALENVAAEFNDRLAAEAFLYNVSIDPAVRKASLQCSTDAGNALSEISARPDLYAALAAAKKSHTATTPADRKLTDLWLTSLARSGAGLGAAKRGEFVTLQQKLTDLQNRYQANLGNDETTIVITAAQAQALPADFVAGSLKKNADGSYTVPVSEATVGPFLQNMSDAAARKAYYIAYNNRGGDANVGLLEQALTVRDRLAHLLGYKSWAAFVLADRMAGSPERVTSFLDQIDRAILPKARAEREEDAALKGAPLDQWDQTYYENQLRKTKYAVDQNEVKQYYPVGHVVDRVLAIYERLLSVSFAKSAQPSWNPSVLAYDVTDTTNGKLRGRFYLDLYPRPGKYNHFANFPLVPRHELPDGSIRLATTAIIGNWPQPAPGKAALLTQGDVETFFHEFGHAMAALLAEPPYESLTSGFRQDFVEAPSQMLENWAWDPAIIKEVSAHAETGAPMPDDLIRKLIATRYVHYALQTTQQVLYADVDMRYHTLPPPVHTTAIWKATVGAVTPNAFIDGTHPQSEFGHLMGGYDAGYYGYLWSKVYAQDLFSRFAREGLTSPAAGLAYRRFIVGPARLREPDAEVRDFLGRPMSPNAFYRELGITPPQNSTK